MCWDNGVGVNKVSCRRGDSDFALQEGGIGTSPPHAHVWLGGSPGAEDGGREGEVVLLAGDGRYRTRSLQAIIIYYFTISRPASVDARPGKKALSALQRGNSAQYVPFNCLRKL